MAFRSSTVLLGALSLLAQVQVSQASPVLASAQSNSLHEASASTHASVSLATHVSAPFTTHVSAPAATHVFTSDSVTTHASVLTPTHASTPLSSAASRPASTAQVASIVSPKTPIESSGAKAESSSGGVDGLSTSVTIGATSISIGNFSLANIVSQLTSELQNVCNSQDTTCDSGSPITWKMDWVTQSTLEPATVTFDVTYSSYDNQATLNAMIAMAANAFYGTAKNGGKCTAQPYNTCFNPGRRSIDSMDTITERNEVPYTGCAKDYSIMTCNMVNYVAVQLFNHTAATLPPPSASLEINATFVGQQPDDFECSGSIGAVGTLLSTVATGAGAVLGAVSAICALAGH